MKNKILIIVAHPDDEILGVGGTLIHHVDEGDDVYVCVATKPYTPYWSQEYILKKEKAQKEIDIFLGVTKRFQLGQPAVKLNTIPSGEFNQMVANVVNKVKPDIIYTHDECDLNYDHKIVFRACLVATRPPKKIKLYTFETLSESEWGNSVFTPNTWVDISRTIDRKLDAMLLYYEIELKDYPHPRSMEGIEILAKYRGSNVHLRYAEAFKLIREIKIFTGKIKNIEIALRIRDG